MKTKISKESLKIFDLKKFLLIIIVYYLYLLCQKMSINSRGFDERLYEQRKNEAAENLEYLHNSREDEKEQPISDEEFKRLAEENMKNEWNSLEWWKFIKRTKMYVWREKLLEKEIERLKNEAHDEDTQRANYLKKQLNEWDDDIIVNSDRTPVK